MCIGVGELGVGQCRERPLDGDQVGDDLDGLGVRFEGIGPAGDLVQVRPDPRQPLPGTREAWSQRVDGFPRA